MSDICLCEGKGCPIKNECKRFAKRSDHINETYFSRTPYVDEVGCKFFIKIEKEMKDALDND